MRKKLSIQALGISVFGMVLLLLISPCSVRNYVQSSFGVSKTEVNNKSKTTLSSSNCVSLKTDADFLSQLNTNFQYLLPENSFSSLKKLFFKHQKDTYSYYKKYLSNSKIPLYILFQNIKIYL